MSINEKVKQHIINKTHKPNALRFWVEGGIIFLYGFGSVLIFVRSLFLPFQFFQQVVSESMVCVTDSDEYSLIPISKVFLTKVLRIISEWGTRIWLEGEYTNVEEGLSLEGKIVSYPSVSLSSTLSRNEKV